MESIKLELMKETINIAIKNDNVFVGVLIANNGKMICSNKYQNNNDWAEYILDNLKKLNINEVEELYLTINTYKDGNFCLNKVIQQIKIHQIYIGLPDPKLNRYLKSDPVLQCRNIDRYPENLQKIIISQNHDSFFNSLQSIKNNIYYSEKRISEFVKEQLLKYGLNISKLEINNNKTRDKLIALLIDKYNFSINDANYIVSTSLSNAFNKKYALYDYKNDVRSINDTWSDAFYEACKELSCDLFNDNVIDVGVGSGNEASKLFKNCKYITFVDIAPDGLKRVKNIIPQSKIIVSSAENLEMINNNEYDIYISLRTFNSSFFNIEKTLKEAKRILKAKSKIMISIANGFLSANSSIIPGLIIPGTEFVDIYKGLDIVKKIVNIMSRLGFENFKLLTTNDEIYLLGKLDKERS